MIYKPFHGIIDIYVHLLYYYKLNLLSNSNRKKEEEKPSSIFFSFCHNLSVRFDAFFFFLSVSFLFSVVLDDVDRVNAAAFGDMFKSKFGAFDILSLSLSRLFSSISNLCTHFVITEPEVRLTMRDKKFENVRSNEGEGFTFLCVLC